MLDRNAIVENFVANSPWHNWVCAPIAGDASARRYLRLTSGSDTVILMDAPLENDEETQPFVELANFLNARGYAAPEVLAHNPEQGIIILSDLGEIDFAQWLLAKPADEQMLYQSATDILLGLEDIDAPQHLKQMTPTVGAEMVAIIGTHYSHKGTNDLCAQVHLALETFAPDPNTLALRDFHAENLIWRSEKIGDDRVGLLDFQDAFLAPPGYDLASLLRDARRNVSPQVADAAIDYFAERTKAKGPFRTSLACLGVQRNLRILGVFARLVTDLAKPRYLAFMPRVWGHIVQDLQDPALADLRQAVMDTVPEPTPAILAGLAA